MSDLRFLLFATLTVGVLLAALAMVRVAESQPTGGSISGTVTDAITHEPLSGIWVEVWNDFGIREESTSTDSSGAYRVDGLPTGYYTVQFYRGSFPDETATPTPTPPATGTPTPTPTPTPRPGSRPSGIYAWEWYNNKADFDSADLVWVEAGTETSGIDAGLALGGSIQGTVTREGTGAPLSDICVTVYDTSHDSAGSGKTDSSGVYRVRGLRTGDYKVRFHDCRSAPIYASEWYNNKADFDAANPVSVTEGSVTTSINAALAVGGSIQGTVTREGTGVPLSDIHVEVYGASHSWAGYDKTDSSGFYSVGGLPTGTYKVEFWDSGGTYLSEWHNDKADFDSADLVPVTQGSVTDDIDAALALGGSIQGTVTREGTGAPLSDIRVEVYGASHSWAGYDKTDSSGFYSVGGLPTGTYKVEFWDSGGTYLSEWHNDKADFDSADPVTVSQGLVTWVNAALALGGSIEGTVTREGTGAQLEDMCATVFDSAHHVVGVDSTNSSGVYSVGGLPTGNYKVEFWDCGPRIYLSEWYNNKADFESADLVPVTQGLVTAGKNAALAVGGAIEGTVTDERTGAELPNMCVAVYDPSCSQIDHAHTDSSGFFSLGGLPTGSYKIEFRNCGSSATHFAEWYNNKPDCGSADPISVIQGSVSGISAALTPHGFIEGTLTREGTGAPLAEICVHAFDPSGQWAGSGYTGSSGFYRVGGLRTGSYKVWFRDCGALTYRSEWHNNKGQFMFADWVLVTQGFFTSGIDAALAVGETDTDGDTIPDSVDVDDDNDSLGRTRTALSGACPTGGATRPLFEDCIELYLGTDPLDACPDNPSDPAWPPDFNNNRTVNILDVLMFPPHLGSSAGDASYSPRFDLNANELINILDVLLMPPHMGNICSN